MGEPQERTSGWIGKVLHDKWRIDAKIARGGVATVFRARHRQGQVAAIKIMHPEYARNEDVRRRFLREGYAANKVGHPGVVSVLDDDVTDDGHAYIVMELLQAGEVLEDKRERLGGTLPVSQTVDICHQVLDVLAAAHENGIIHRDIKPENIFVLDDGTVKVLDFGIAHIKDEVAKHEPTATGLLLGTPDYMSPEQALGKRGHIDAQTDVYAVGAMMFTLLSGEAVHVTDTLTALLVAAASRQARSLASTGVKDLPRELVAVVDKAVMLEKPRRWASARAMQAALRAAVPGVVSTRMLRASAAPTGATAAIDAASAAAHAAILGRPGPPSTSSAPGSLTDPAAASYEPTMKRQIIDETTLERPRPRMKAARAEPVEVAPVSLPTVVRVVDTPASEPDSVPPASSATAAYVMPPRAAPKRVSLPPPAAPGRKDGFDRPIDDDDEVPTALGLNPIAKKVVNEPKLDPWTDEDAADDLDGPTISTGSVPALPRSLFDAVTKPSVLAHRDDGERTRPVAREDLVAPPPPKPVKPVPAKPVSVIVKPSVVGQKTAKLDLPRAGEAITATLASASDPGAPQQTRVGSSPSVPPPPPPRQSTVPAFTPQQMHPSHAPHPGSMPPPPPHHHGHQGQQGHAHHPSMPPPWNAPHFGAQSPGPMTANPNQPAKSADPSPLMIAVMAFVAFLVISLSLGSCLWLRSQ